MELDTQFQVAANLGYLQRDDLASLLQLCAELGKVLNGLLASVSAQAGS